MDYREHAPGAVLASWLHCGWERRGDGGDPVRVVPDGSIDIVWTDGAGLHVVGANTTAFLVDVPAGVRVAGARMRPGAGAALLGIDAAALRDTRVPLDEIWDDDARRLEERVATSGAPLGALLAALAERAPRTAPPDPLIAAAVERLHEPRTRVEQLADELALSARQLRRRFEASVGYGPKRLARVLRLERALASARAGEELAAAAAEAGYADQPHLVHECRALAGVTPAVLLH
jgi:AraC-like DNA-binding protein